MPFPPSASSVNAQAATPTDPAADDGRYLAVLARDARFDGHFFTGVTSTGIYCRPVCAVRAPRRENCRFFALAAQAESAGFRAEGVLRQRSLHRGVPVDDVIYGLLATDPRPDA